MAGLRAVWEASHGKGSVIGLAPSAVAAQVLSDELGIETENTAKWLTEWRRIPELTERRDRVRRMLRLMQDLGDNARMLSEIDVSDRDNLKVSQPYDGRIVTVFLGDHNFGARYQNFVNHYAEIKRRLPGSARTCRFRG